MELHNGECQWHFQIDECRSDLVDIWETIKVETTTYYPQGFIHTEIPAIVFTLAYITKKLVSH